MNRYMIGAEERRESGQTCELVPELVTLYPPPLLPLPEPEPADDDEDPLVMIDVVVEPGKLLMLVIVFWIAIDLCGSYWLWLYKL